MPKTLAEIEELSRFYHASLAALDQQVNETEEEISEVKKRRLPAIRETIDQVQLHRQELLEAVAESPEAFTKPKSKVFHRIKVGWRKAAGKVVVPDEAKVIAAIKRMFPRPQAERLINVTEKANKTALADLSGADLKKLGVQVTDDTDEAFVKPVDGEIEKLAADLVNEGKDK